MTAARAASLFAAHATASPKRKNWLGAFVDIAKGGRRTLETAKAVASMVEIHKDFKRRKAEGGAPKEATDAYLLAMATAFRDMVMKNGGFQVKVGQMLSMNSAILCAIFPEVVAKTLHECCEGARALPLDDVMVAIENRDTGLGRRLHDVFLQIESRALAAASIAQVHRATLKACGSRVLVKVQHPGVRDSMAADVAILPALISLVDMLEPNHGLRPMMFMIEAMLRQEMDFRIEGANRERLAAVVDRSRRTERSQFANVVFPVVYWDYCCESVMVQEFAEGAVSLGSRAAVQALGVPYAVALRELSIFFAEGAFVHGYMHNDLHTGNAMLVQTALFSIVAAAVFFGRDPDQLSQVLKPAAGESVAERGARLLEAYPRAAALGEALLAKHAAAKAALELRAAELARVRFDLVIIDHGFHTHVSYETRLAWCKCWAAIGLCDEELLVEAAADFGLEGDDYKHLPMMLSLFPYPLWPGQETRAKFPTSKAPISDLLKSKDWGVMAFAEVLNKKMPREFHLMHRTSQQVGALFQIEYGMGWKSGLEFLRLMTRHALLGLRFRDRAAAVLPVPGELKTPDRAWFDREGPRAGRSRAYELEHEEVRHRRARVRRPGPRRLGRDVCPTELKTGGTTLNPGGSERRALRMGGFSEWSLSTPAFEQQLGDDALLTLEKRVRADFLDMQSEGANVYADYPKVCQYRRQVVAGTNYDLLVSAGDMIWEVRMFQPLPHTGEPTMITEFERITEITTWWAESE
ncbi:hypothetical protein JL722_12283 [Aureococcus anophagefferens]|nr:hypothetical protein JL722_12283 [Aureococcus anophagefferens]